MKPLFNVGRTLMTPHARAELVSLKHSPLDLLHRHITGDWSEMDEEDAQANQDALHHGSRIFSAYVVKNTKFWIITEADRSSTTILLPSEY